MLVSPFMVRAEPNVINYGQPVQLTIYANDKRNGEPVSGKVIIDSVIVADTNTPFNYTFPRPRVPRRRRAFHNQDVLVAPRRRDDDNGNGDGDGDGPEGDGEEPPPQIKVRPNDPGTYGTFDEIVTGITFQYKTVQK